MTEAPPITVRQHSDHKFLVMGEMQMRIWDDGHAQLAGWHGYSLPEAASLEDLVMDMRRLMDAAEAAHEGRLPS